MTVGPAFADYSYGSMLKAVYLMAKNNLQPGWLGGPPRTYVQVTGLANRDALERLARLCEDKNLETIVGSCCSFEDALKGYDELHSGHARGKIVVRIGLIK